MTYNISRSNIKLTFNSTPFSLSVSAVNGENIWNFANDPTVVLKNGSVVHFDDAECSSSVCNTGVSEGVHTVYSSFKNEDGSLCDFSIETTVRIDTAAGDLVIEANVIGDNGSISSVFYPTRIVYDAEEGHGYTVLPRMQGTLIPAGHPSGIPNDAFVYDRDAYMPFYAQIKDGSGYLAIFETPFDAKFRVIGEDIQPFFITSLGKMGYKRVMRYRLFDGDYVKAAKLYREYATERGRVVTLREKIVKNPNVQKLFGTPIIHTLAAMRIHPKSYYYNKENPEKNNICTPFSVIEERLRTLKDRGLDKAYLHLDGWGVNGYDNSHPDPFPINEKAGGVEGLKSLQSACHELGYYFGVHDQYHDYYYDAATFNMKNAIVNEDGTNLYCDIWAGGPHTYLCETLAPDYVRRNYDEFNRLGIKLDGAYLDVFSIITLDECFSVDHPMTREQCAAERRRCFDILTSRGIITSSEEAVECVINSISLCHYAPFYTHPPELNFGIPIPLFNLVYHDCMVIPWGTWSNVMAKGGYGVPENDRGFYWAILNGGTVYCSLNEKPEDIEYLKIALELQEKVALCEMERHEFVDGDPRHRKSVFSDGTEVECDFDNEWFAIRYPDGRTVTGK